MITEIEETAQTRTGTTTTTTITTIANDGCQTILVEDVAIMTMMTETGAETTAGDDDRILEIQTDILIVGTKRPIVIVIIIILVLLVIRQTSTKDTRSPTTHRPQRWV